MQTDCGYTPKEIREMTLSDVQRLSRHWRTMPPLRVWVAGCAAALGVQMPESESQKQYTTANEFARFAQVANRVVSAPNG